MSRVPNTLPRVAIVGRPNVGKSTLFNRLLGHRRAITLDTPGVTRDAIAEEVDWYGHSLVLVDTGGLQGEQEIALADEVHEQTVRAIGDSDLLVVLLDAQSGVSPLDRETVELVNRSGVPAIYVANKADTYQHELASLDLCRLGIDAPITVSAEHTIGLGELKDAIIEALGEVFAVPEPEPEIVEDEGAESSASPGIEAVADGTTDEEADGSEDEAEARMVKVALVGRPNVGKSSFLNLLAGEKLSLVDDRPGTTRDVVDTAIERNGKKYLLIDTAGLRRRARIYEAVEKISASRTMEAVGRADIVVLLVEPEEGLTDQDARIAGHAWDEGRAVVIVFNKIDLVGWATGRLQQLKADSRHRYPTLGVIPVEFMSVTQERGVDKVFETIDAAERAHNFEFSTSFINDMLITIADRRQPPVIGRGRIRFLYGTQTAKRPPTITVFTNRKGVPEDYARFMERCFRERLSLEGSPLRLRFVRRESHGDKER